MGRLIGRGGQGAVYEAIGHDGSELAVKTFAMPPGTDPKAEDAGRERFKREIEVTSRLSHPNIVEILDSAVDADEPFYVMPRADGSLLDLIKQHPRGMSLDLALPLFEPICSAVEYAHARNVLHRDLKPQNILMYSGIPKVSDFGLGRDLNAGHPTMTQSREGWGTYAYMAPEQKVALHLAAKPADVYSLGVILFEMTTGISPHRAKIDMHEVPADLHFVLSRCLQDNEAHRWPHAAALYDEIISFRNGSNDSPVDTAGKALRAFLSGDHDEGLLRLAKVLFECKHDEELYRDFFPRLPRRVLKALPDLESLLEFYDEQYARPNSNFVYTDTIADFYYSAIQVVTDVGISFTLLETVLRQASDNNRWHAGRKFVEICQVMSKEPARRSLIGKVIAENPDSVHFLRENELRFELPRVLTLALSKNRPSEH